MVSQKSYEFIYDRLEETRKENGHSAEKEEVVKKAAPAKKRSSRKSHVEELEAKNGASRST